MQAPLCIILIVFSVALFWIGMVRSNSEVETSIKSIESMFRDQGAGHSSTDENQADSGESAATPAKHPHAKERARSTLLIELPTTQRVRSLSESYSLKQSYLSLHQEFTACESFLDQMANRIRNDDELHSLLAGSLAHGPIPLDEILLQRLTFSLEGTGGRETPVLVLTALGETQKAAEQLAALAQVLYFL